MTAEPFPAAHETQQILEEVRVDDRIVYFESCTRLPLEEQLADRAKATGRLVVVGAKAQKDVAERQGIERRTGTYEKVPVESGWATLVIGECSLDEFQDAEKALSEAWRILAPRGRLMLSGPIRSNASITPNLLALDEIEALLTRLGFSVVHVTDLTTPLLELLLRSHTYARLAEAIACGHATFVLVRATK